MHAPSPPVSIEPLTAADPAEVNALLDAAFGEDRRRRTAYRIRDGMTAIRALSFAAFDEAHRLLGSLQCWPVALDFKTPLVLVGPVAVVPDLQRGGIGQRMMAEMIEVAEASGADPLVLIGDPEYYGRFFGFDAHWTREWTVPGPVERRRLLARVPTGGTLPVIGHLGPHLHNPALLSPLPPP